MTRNEQWQRVLERDARYDGAFVYAVRSTGVYCRPSCPSRRPKPQSVLFFTAPDAAERAGYRACRRCHPQRAQAPAQELVQRVVAFIESHVEEGPVQLRALAAAIKVSPFHLQRTFKRHTGVSPRQYAERLRAQRLSAELRDGNGIADATFGAGYGSSSRVYERAADTLGMTPGALRAGGRGMHVRYALAPCTLGLLLVAETDRGVCRVALG